jgi:hypothetical protein
VQSAEKGAAQVFEDSMNEKKSWGGYLRIGFEKGLFG